MLIRIIAIALALFVFAPGQRSTAAGPVVSDSEMATTNEAREIAAGEGIRRFDAMRFNQKTGHWEIEGRDATDRPIALEIEANTGAVVRLLRRPEPVDEDGDE